jgi:ABC-type antimicrobial peptide transport system permease subunit
VYTPWEVDGAGMSFFNLAIRTSADPGTLAPGIRSAIWAQNAELPIRDIVTMEGRMGRTMATERFYLVLLGGFAGIALLLAAGGLYATLLYSVRQRRREMGIRLALGARGTDVVGLVLRRGLAQTAVGLAIGLGAALLGVRVLESLVFEISTRDPRTLAVVSGVLLGVALLACLAPAIRAGRTDPAETLRAD